MILRDKKPLWPPDIFVGFFPGRPFFVALHRFGENLPLRVSSMEKDPGPPSFSDGFSVSRPNMPKKAITEKGIEITREIAMFDIRIPLP